MNNNTKGIIIQVEKKCKLRKDNIVTLQRQGETYAEVRRMDIRTKPGVKRISKDEYEVIKTGEIKKYNHDKNDGKINSDLRKTFARLRGLIRTNFTAGGTNQLFVTLTYKKNMRDGNQMCRDFNNFMARLRRTYKEHSFEYIVVVEPQKRGAWHMHMMLKSDKYLYIDNKDMARIWGHGATKTERLKSDDVGTYYVAYFTDILTPQGVKESKKSPDGRKITGKMKEKGARLHFYPKNFKFYRTSRGIKRPEDIKLAYRDVLNEYGDPVYTQTTEIKNEQENMLLNRIHFSVHKKDKEVNE